jgi:hypothetical protein
VDLGTDVQATDNAGKEDRSGINLETLDMLMAIRGHVDVLEKLICISGVVDV